MHVLGMNIVCRRLTQALQTCAGHVTAGGSICIEALTLSGTPGSWTSQYNVESILNIVILNMIGEATFFLAIYLPLE